VLGQRLTERHGEGAGAQHDHLIGDIHRRHAAAIWMRRR
jgi:hypothetical protein